MTLDEYGAGQQSGTSGLLDQSWGGILPPPKEQHSCPNCGYCPCCGRSNPTYTPVPYHPYQLYYPYYAGPYIGDGMFGTTGGAQAVQGTTTIN